MSLPDADTVIAALRRSRHIEDAARELGIGKRSVSNVLERAGVGTPGQYLYGVAPIVAAPTHEATPRVEERAPVYTGAPPPDFDDLAETRKTDPIPPPESGPGVAKCKAAAEPFREERILFIPDSHFPYEDKRAWQLMLRVGRFFRPHRIVVLGDMCDMYSTSFHDRSPTRVSRLADELAETARGLDDLDSLGAERKHLLQGNHEHRMVRTIAKVAPQLHGLRGLTLEEQLDLDSRGWTHSKYMEEYHIGNLSVCHDWGRAGLNALKQVVDTLSRDIVQGHTHRAQTYHSVSRKTGETVRGDSFGCLLSFDELDYCHRAMAAEWWAHAVGVGWTQPDTSVRREVVRFLNGSAKIEGQRV